MTGPRAYLTHDIFITGADYTKQFSRRRSTVALLATINHLFRHRAIALRITYRFAAQPDHGSRTMRAGPGRGVVGSASASMMPGTMRTPLLTLPGGASTLPRLQPCERPS